jgi:hypothetical protein
MSGTVAQGNEAPVTVPFRAHDCAHCRSSIATGERWVREKIYEPLTASNPRYRRYHADLFTGEALSCWEKHLMEQEITESGERAA